MADLTKRKIGKQDHEFWDGGATSTFTAENDDGRTMTLADMDWVGVDAHGLYGARNGAAIQSAVTSIGGTRKAALWLSPGQWTLSANITLSSNITLVPAPGAYITLGTYTLAINGGVEAGVRQIFDENSTGAVDMTGSSSIEYVMPQWWGGMTSATVQAAVTAYPYAVYCPAGTYVMADGDSIDITVDDTHIWGAGPATIFSKSVATGTGQAYFAAVSMDGFKIHDFQIAYASTYAGLVGRIGVKATTCTNVEIHNITMAVTAAGLPSHTQIQNGPVGIYNCEDVNISGIRSSNTQVCVGLSNLEAGRSERVNVSNCFYEMDHANINVAYPAAFNLEEAKDVVFDNCHVKGAHHNTDNGLGGSATGYGFYQGDERSEDADNQSYNIKWVNCSVRESDCGFGIKTARNYRIDNCEAWNEMEWGVYCVFQDYDWMDVDAHGLTITNSKLYCIYITGTDDVLIQNNVIDSSDFYEKPGGYDGGTGAVKPRAGIWVLHSKYDETTYYPTNTKVLNNIIRESQYSGICLQNVFGADIIGNTIINPNVANYTYTAAGDYGLYCDGIGLFACGTTTIKDNHITCDTKTSAVYNMEYGIWIGPQTYDNLEVRNNVYKLENNYIDGFANGAYAGVGINAGGGRGLLTTYPSVGKYPRGYILWNLLPDVSGGTRDYIGYVCVARYNQLIDGGEAAGQTVITVDDTTGFAVDDVVGFALTGTDETHWTEIAAVDGGGTDFTIDDAIPASHSCADNAEVWVMRWRTFGAID